MLAEIQLHPLLEGYDEPEILRPQAVSFVSQVLKRDSHFQKF
jgi:hypothetical protein